MQKFILIFIPLILVANCAASNLKKEEVVLSGDYQIATFAGGCFWCVEASFEKLPGVFKVVSGYSGGVVKNPSYNQVAGGQTKHRESVQVYYHPKTISYGSLVAAFWRMYDPSDVGGSFYDRGRQYTSAIFYHDDNQKKIATDSKIALIAKGMFRKVVTPIEQFTNFYPAEFHHQDYYKKNRQHYSRYLSVSGREGFIKKTWGDKEAYLKIVLHLQKSETLMLTNSPNAFIKPSPKELKNQLSRMEYFVTQEDGTEPPFNNRYWDNKKKGIYVDVVSKRVLFSSTHKYKSGTGWPSFYLSIDSSEIVEKKDYSHGMVRIEVRSRTSDSHLGHLFKDGPKPTGLRYCINSAALKFIPKEEMKDNGYGDYLYLFD